MKKVILLAIVLIVGCDSPTETKDCSGVVGGNAVEDCAGICNGNTPEENCLIGSWKSTESKLTYNSEATINISTENEYYLYVFNLNDSATYTSSQSLATTSTNDEIDSNVEEFMISIYSGTWMVNNNQIVFEGYNETNGKSMSVNWYYNLNNDILILSNIEKYEHGVTDGLYITFQKQ